MRSLFIVCISFFIHIFFNLTGTIFSTELENNQKSFQINIKETNHNTVHKSANLQDNIFRPVKDNKSRHKNRQRIIEHNECFKTTTCSMHVNSKTKILSNQLDEKRRSITSKTKVCIIKTNKISAVTLRNCNSKTVLMPNLIERKFRRINSNDSDITQDQYKNIKIKKQYLCTNKRYDIRYKQAKLTAIKTLISQIGKPYHWGGASPDTGFDCSGLIYYAYKDLVRVPLPRTANEMYHLRNALFVSRSKLEIGDLVFFHIHNHNYNMADHVGVYLGNNKFIQSPRTGKEISISCISKSYWRRHYIGARRVVTPCTVR